MVKRFLYICIALSGLLYGCANSDDSVFEETADQRINQALAKYQTMLTGSQDGWDALVYPASGGVYSFYIRFSEDNRVVMYSDFDDQVASAPKESSYRLKAMQTPALIFDTYSYLHILSDPDPDVNNGTTGEGLRSDFEFSFYGDSVSTDRIALVGRRNKSRMVLTRASSSQKAAYESGAMGKNVGFHKIATLHSYFKRASISGVQYEIVYNPAKRTISFTWLNSSGNLVTYTTPYYYTAEGLQLVNPLMNGSQTINQLSDISWTESTKTINFSVNGAKSAIVEASAPLKPDNTAGRTWWQMAVNNDETYWVSWMGFHINGVDDALKVRDLTAPQSEFGYLLYWPGIGSNYDAFAPVFFNTQEGSVNILYGNAVSRPVYTNDGRVVFSHLGTIGTEEYPTSGPAVESARILYNSRGFYFIRTSAETYDMVSAADPRIWISWEFL